LVILLVAILKRQNEILMKTTLKEATEKFNADEPVNLISKRTGNVNTLTREVVAQMFGIAKSQVRLTDVLKNGGFKLA